MHNVTLFLSILFIVSSVIVSELWSEYSADIRSIHKINLTTDPNIAVNNICGPLDFGCIAGILQTHQNGRLYNVQKLRHEYFSNNDSGTMVTNLYLSRLIGEHMYSSRVCMFGDIHLETVLLVLMYCKKCQLVIGIRTPAARYTSALEQLFPDSNIFLFHEGTYHCHTFKNRIS